MKNIESQSYGMALNFKSQFSKTKFGSWEVYLSKYKHKTQGKGKILSQYQVQTQDTPPGE